MVGGTNTIESEENDAGVIINLKNKKVAKVKPNPRKHGGCSKDAQEDVKQSLSVASNPPKPKISGGGTETGINTECLQLVKNLWNLHVEANAFYMKSVKLLYKTHNALLTKCSDPSNTSSPSGGTEYKPPSEVNPLTPVSIDGSLPKNLKDSESATLLSQLLGDNTNSWLSLSLLSQELNYLSSNIFEIEKQFNAISSIQSQAKLVLYAKILHARKHVQHDHLAILHTVHEVIISIIQVISTTSSPFGQLQKENLSHVFQLAESYNSSLESIIYKPPVNSDIQNEGTPSPLPVPGAGESGDPTQIASPMFNSPSLPLVHNFETKVHILRQVNTVTRNDSPKIKLELKPFTGLRLLNVYLEKRIFPASKSFNDVVQNSFTKKLGSKLRYEPEPSIKFDVDLNILALSKFESTFNEEDSRINVFSKSFYTTPSLLGPGALVSKDEQEGTKVSRSVRVKMLNYFRRTLWTLVGETGQELLFWSYDSNNNALPLVLYPVDTFLLLRDSLSVSGQIGNDNPNISTILRAFESISSSIHSFTLLGSWDERMSQCFEISLKIKRPEQLQLTRNPTSESEWATIIGRKFGEIITTCISLVDRRNEGLARPQSAKINNSQANKTNEYGNLLLPESGRRTNAQTIQLQSSEEEPLLDEAQIFFRLEATLEYYMSWVVKRSKLWLNAWAITQFLATSQRDSKLIVQLIKSRESVLITREVFLANENVAVRLSAKQRQSCANDFKEMLDNLQKMPEELLQSVGPVCRTLSLATFQSSMPNPNHWRGIGPGSGLDPDKPSPYVQIFINRVVEPVMLAAVEFVSPAVQEAMGKQVIHAGCDAWLQHILQKRIKFSEWGAVQLLRDFMSFKYWLRNDALLHDDARRGILQLEVLKRCEGVAYLLFRSPGDLLGVGKSSKRIQRRSRSDASQQISPSPRRPQGSRESSSPSISESSITEDDIPPEMYVPNQQVWLELRLRRTGFAACCD